MPSRTTSRATRETRSQRIAAAPPGRTRGRAAFGRADGGATGRASAAGRGHWGRLRGRAHPNPARASGRSRAAEAAAAGPGGPRLARPRLVMTSVPPKIEHAAHVHHRRARRRLGAARA